MIEKAAMSVTVFCLHISKLRVLNSWWPLNRGENNGRILIGTAKRRPQPLNGSSTVFPQEKIPP